MRSIIKRRNQTQVGFVRKLFKSSKKRPPFGNPARQYRKISYDDLRKDMLAVFLNPSRHAEMRQRWTESHPQNMWIRQALKHMAFERQNPKRKAEWAKAPKSILEELVRSSIEGQISIVKSEDEAIKTNGKYGRGILESAASQMSRGTRKRIRNKWKKEQKDTNRNVDTISKAISQIAKRNKHISSRIKEIGNIFIGCARAGDANIALTGLGNTFAKQLTGKNLNQKLLGEEGFVELSQLSNLSQNEISQVAQFAAELAESMAKNESIQKTRFTESELRQAFNEQYLKFLVLRLQLGKDGVKTKGLLTT